MGPIHDVRHTSCLHASTQPNGKQSCDHPIRALLYPATGCEQCPVLKRRPVPHTSDRGTSRPLRFNHDD